MIKNFVKSNHKNINLNTEVITVTHPIIKKILWTENTHFSIFLEDGKSYGKKYVCNNSKT